MDDHENTNESAATPAGGPAGGSARGSVQDSVGTTPSSPVRPSPGIAAPAKKSAAKKAPVKAAPAKAPAPAPAAPAKAVPGKHAAKRTAKKAPAPRKRPAVVDIAAAEKVVQKVAEKAAEQVAVAAAETDATPEVVYRPTGPAEANSEQELASHDGQDDNENVMELSEDGDQSVGAVAAFARAVAAAPAGTGSAGTAPAGTAPAGDASAEDVEKAWKDNRLAQVLYHDWEAKTYDEKWSISFDDRCITYARDRFSALLGPQILRDEVWPYGKALEIGAGTGFFSLNLKQAGVLSEVHVSDVSAGMVENAQSNARKLGFEVTGTVSGAESLPYEDNTFDIVVGHAVIHHIPDVESALREILRVLKPGGRFVIAGEPTRIGDWYARRLGRVTWALTTRVTKLKPFRDRWAKSQEELDESSRAAALEAVVDLHTFVPDELIGMAHRAGASQVKTQTEELLAAFLGWPVRTFEAAVNPERLGFGWSMFAYKSWLRLSAADRVLSKAVPQKYFYNVGITGTKRA